MASSRWPPLSGPYDQIPLTAHALLAWAGEHGHTPRGPLREVYLSEPRHSPAADSPELVEFGTVRGRG